METFLISPRGRTILEDIRFVAGKQPFCQRPYSSDTLDSDEEIETGYLD
jgi:hypothetical protein